MRQTLVIPCFNEASRLDEEQIRQLIDAGIHLVFVNDGSTDTTWDVLGRVRAGAPDAIALQGFMRNVGKGEAVRRGLRKAIADGAGVVGFADADFATPTPELLRLLARLHENPTVEIVMGSRLLRLGANVRRSPWRHTVGRIFAAFAARAVGMAVYDTQCGAKFFRVSPMLEAALAQPFVSRWAFDVELLARLHRGVGGPGRPRASFVEVPLDVWLDQDGSKLTTREMLSALRELPAVYRSARALGQPAGGTVPE